MKIPRKRCTPEEDAVLRKEALEGTPIDEIARKTGRTVRSRGLRSPDPCERGKEASWLDPNQTEPAHAESNLLAHIRPTDTIA